MASEEEIKNRLVTACKRLLIKEKSYGVVVPKVLESDFGLIAKLLGQLEPEVQVTRGKEVKTEGDLA